MTSYDGHRISFEEAPLLINGITAGYLHSGYVELDTLGDIEIVSLNNMEFGKKRAEYRRGDGVIWSMLSHSLSQHLKDDLATISDDVEGWSNFNANREYGTHDARAL